VPEYIQLIREFIVEYPAIEFFIIFFVAGGLGEIGLFIVSFLAAERIFSLAPLIIFAYLGVLSFDLLWFYIGQTKLTKNIISHRYAHKPVSLIVAAIDKISKGNRLTAIVFAKFLVGTRVVLIMYVSKNKIEVLKFIQYNTIATFLWMLIVAPIGFVAGLGFTYLSRVFDNIYAAIGFILLVLVIFIAFQLYFEKRVSKETEGGEGVV
jgi:membrane protein DedA with SNARE-associated domain